MSGIVAFVPAAGASSRFYAPFVELDLALKDRDFERARRSSLALAKLDSKNFPLPENLAKTLLLLEKGEQPEEALVELALSELEQPKGLLPCVHEGLTFLELKHLEHEHLGFLEGEVFVSSGKYAEKFSKKSKALVQGPNESTIRFDSEGKPVKVGGRYSLVPGGHGTLVRLFAEVKQQFPKSHVLFIRNIDNVSGTSPAVEAATKLFFIQYMTALEFLREIRHNLDEGKVNEAAEIAQKLLKKASGLTQNNADIQFLQSLSEPEKVLWELQCRLFHFQPGLFGRGFEPDLKHLKNLYRRPFNCLGQVPNRGHDVGGTPTFVETKYGPMKICLELPHASAEDKKIFLENPKKATHFNPVFVAAEMDFPEGNYDDAELPFWLLSEKKYQGKKVYYHETILYEFLGNSLLSNLIFVEIPRILFNPHKSILDVAGSKKSLWHL